MSNWKYVIAKKNKKSGNMSKKDVKVVIGPQVDGRWDRRDSSLDDSYGQALLLPPS